MVDKRDIQDMIVHTVDKVPVDKEDAVLAVDKEAVVLAGDKEAVVPAGDKEAVLAEDKEAVGKPCMDYMGCSLQVFVELDSLGMKHNHLCQGNHQLDLS